MVTKTSNKYVNYIENNKKIGECVSDIITGPWNNAPSGRNNIFDDRVEAVDPFSNEIMQQLEKAHNEIAALQKQIKLKDQQLLEKDKQVQYKILYMYSNFFACLFNCFICLNY